MFPQTQDLPSLAVAENASAELGKSFLFDFSKGDFVMHNGKLVQTNDITVWIEKIIRTEKDRYKIYNDTDYGVRLEDLVIGTNYDLAFAESEIRREIEDALLTHPQITGISNFRFIRTPSGAEVSMEVICLDQTRNITATFK